MSIASQGSTPHTPRVDIPTFLLQYPPFDELDEEGIPEVVRHTHIEFFPKGRTILQQSGEPSRYLYVVRTGAVEVLSDGRVADLLGEGEVFGQFSLLSGLGPTFTIRALEDSICYLIDSSVAEMVMGTQRGLAFLSRTLRRREIRALEGSAPVSPGPGTVMVGSLIRRPPVTCSLVTTVREAAQLMAQEHVSCLLIPKIDGWGIITDQDLRVRVLALGRSQDTVVSEIMTYPAKTIPTHTLVVDVILEMLEAGVHHFPVVDGDGELVGVVTDTDVMGLEQKTPFNLKNAIERATREGDVVEAAARLPEAICSLVESGVEPLHVAQIIAVTRDAVTRRLIELAVSRLGDPPAPWAWLALGSEARYEQALFTDQDHAIAYDPKGTVASEVDPYFAELAEQVTTGIEGSGIRRCRAGVIASNRDWRRSVEDWVLLFTSWMEDLSPTGSAFTGIAFDFRRIAGALDVEPILHETIRRAPHSQHFIRLLARAALDVRLPTGFFRDLVVEAKGGATNLLDVKHSGITPITNLARVWSIGVGLTENRTLQRLRSATETGSLKEETRTGLEESFRLLWQIRLEHQTAQVRRGAQPDDEVDPRTLGPLARQGVKEAFRVIEHSLQSLATELGLRR